MAIERYATIVIVSCFANQTQAPTFTPRLNMVRVIRAD